MKGKKLVLMLVAIIVALSAAVMVHAPTNRKEYPARKRERTITKWAGKSIR